MQGLARGIAGPDPGPCFVAVLGVRQGVGRSVTGWCPVLRRFLETFNDALPDGERQGLLPFADDCLRALAAPGVMNGRAEILSRWLLGQHCIPWLRELRRADTGAEQEEWAFPRSEKGFTDLAAEMQIAYRRTQKTQSRGGHAPSAEAGVAVRTLTQTSGAVAGAAGLAPLLEEHLEEESYTGRVVRTGWSAWGLGWSAAEALAQLADENHGRIYELRTMAEALRPRCWTLFRELIAM